MAIEAEADEAQHLRAMWNNEKEAVKALKVELAKAREDTEKLSKDLEQVINVR